MTALAISSLFQAAIIAAIVACLLWPRQGPPPQVPAYDPWEHNRPTIYPAAAGKA